MDLNNYISKFNNFDDCYSKCNCNCTCREKWSEIPYPGMSEPHHGIDPSAGTWPVYFLKRTNNSNYCTLLGEKIVFDIKNPNTIDFYTDLREVQDVQNNLTCIQKESAKFWGNGVPAQQWSPIFLKLFTAYNVTPPKSARILSCLQNTMNDAFTITWMYKYYWNVARPCQLDKTLKTTIPTPIFPSYPSGHSVVSAAIEVVLSFFFPDEYPTIHQMAEDASISRLYGGIHFRSDLSEGLKLGRQIGQICVNHLKTQHEIEYLIFRE
ncbi:MAG: vanadium-dependent haloperoxidase [Sarcina sp.]